MFTRFSQAALLTALLLCASCSSTPETSSQINVDPAMDSVENVARDSAQPKAAASASTGEKENRKVPDFFAPKPWTGAFSETAVMVADTVRIEGPDGLLDHVVAASDDNFYERTAEVTPQGFRQTVSRTGPDSPEIRVRIDRWTLAATRRVVILENINACEVTVVAGGEALWRDVDGNVARADRLEFVGEIGQNTPVRPLQMVEESVAFPEAPAPDTSAPDTSAPDASSTGASAPGTAAQEGADSDESRSSTANGTTEESNGGYEPNAGPNAGPIHEPVLEPSQAPSGSGV